MVFKINISEKTGKTWKLETDSESLIDKKLNETIKGEDISEDLKGYELEITGASDKSGFTSMKEVEGIGLKRILLTYGKGMKKRPKREGKKKISNSTPKGLRLRKTVRGNTISESTRQINMKVTKEGSKTLTDIYTPKEEATPQSE
jgi:ribosomal protein S6E (S10)